MSEKKHRPSLYKSEFPRFTLSINRVLDWFVWVNLNEERKIDAQKMTLSVDDPRLIEESERFEKFYKQLEENEKNHAHNQKKKE
jgi:hypothetical protein